MHKKVRKISKDYNKIAEKALKSDSQMNEMKTNHLKINRKIHCTLI